METKAQTDAHPWLPDRPTLRRLEEAARDCRGCELYQHATQVVFSSGTTRAQLMLVGEQPGDREDVTGEPFVGPAGRVLDEALTKAGLDRKQVYLTNAVKHFRFTERGKRRIHEKPDIRHLIACSPWLEAEVALVDPAVIVCLGATAGRAVLGRSVTISDERGEVLPLGDRLAVVTTHPAALLRLRGKEGYREAFKMLVEDLRLAASAV